jgi:hypothetical protein
MTQYTYDMRIYLGKDMRNATQTMTATYATVRIVTQRADGIIHDIYMDNFFSSPDLFDDLPTRGINYCGTVTQNCKVMPESFDSKTLKLEQGHMC